MAARCCCSCEEGDESLSVTVAKRLLHGVASVFTEEKEREEEEEEEEEREEGREEAWWTEGGLSLLQDVLVSLFSLLGVHRF